MTYGTGVDRLSGTAVGVIGAVARTSTGNLVLRIGRLNDDGKGWEQTEVVVLTPAEARELIAEIRQGQPEGET